MVIKLKFDGETHYKNNELKQKEPNAIVFYKDGWNDYGYEVEFDVYYYDEIGKEHPIGLYRIFHSKEAVTDWNEIDLDIDTYSYLNSEDSKMALNDADLSKDEGFFSIASHDSFYEILYDLLGAKECKVVLDKLRDITSLENIEGILSAEALDSEGTELYSKVIFREGWWDEVKQVIAFQVDLRNLDKDLTIYNYNNEANIEKFINSTNKDNLISSFIFSDILTDGFLEGLIHKYKEIYNNFTPNEDYKFIKKLIETVMQQYNQDYSQLLAELEACVNEDLRNIYDGVEKIKEILRYKYNESDIFVHYTSLSTLDLLIQPKATQEDNENRVENKEKDKREKQDSVPQLRLSNTRQLNDPTEGNKLLNILFGDDNDFLKPLDEDYTPSTFYLSSMSKVEKTNSIDDSLPMWKMYGGNASGVSMTYDKAFIKAIIDSGVDIYKVWYMDSLKIENDSKIIEALNEIKNSFEELKNNKEKETLLQNGMALIESIRYLFKETSYRYENEYRIIKEENSSDKVLTEKFGGIAVPRLYVYLDLGKGKDLKYTKVTIGPNAEDIDFIAPYIKHCDRNIKVKKSKIAYR